MPCDCTTPISGWATCTPPPTILSALGATCAWPPPPPTAGRASARSSWAATSTSASCPWRASSTPAATTWITCSLAEYDPRGRPRCSTGARCPITPRSGRALRAIPRQLQHLGGGLRRRPAVKRRLGVVLDRQLDRLRHVRAGDARGQRQRHVDPRGHAGRGDHLPLLDDSPAH